MLRRLSTIAIIGLFTAAHFGVPLRISKQPDDLASKMESYLEAAAAFGFSGSVLMAVDGKVLVNKGYGMADRSRNIPIRVNDAFDIGSVTKQFTAAAIMKLEMQGKLKTEDLISKYFDNVPADKAEITLHQTLTHTAGFINYSGGDYDVSERDETIKRILAAPLTHKPGTQYAYSNSGYSILAAIVEKVSGQGYETFLSEQLFKPAGMTSTGYVLPKFDKAKLPHAYDAGKDLGTALDYKWSPTGPYWNLFGNGGIFSTTGDMYKWYQALQGEKVLSAAVKKKMFAPFLSNYAYGWSVQDTPQGRLITHNGASDNGFNAVIGFFPDKGTVGIVLSNAGSYFGAGIYSDTVMKKLGRLMAGDDAQLPMAKFISSDQASLAKLTGTYRMSSGDGFEVSMIGPRLVIEPVGQSASTALGQFTKLDSPEFTGVNEKAKSIVEGISKKDYGPFKNEIANEAMFDRLKGTLEQRIAAWEKSDGAYQSFQIVGTVPTWWANDLVPATFVKLKFETRSRLFRIHWKEGKITTIGGAGIAAPITIPLQSTSATDFVGWHAVTTRPIEVRFPTDGKKLTIIANGVSTIAQRSE